MCGRGGRLNSSGSELGGGLGRLLRGQEAQSSYRKMERKREQGKDGTEGDRVGTELPGKLP